MEPIKGIFEPDTDFIVEDVNEKKVNGTSVLARVEGQFFVPDGTSRNKRFYTRALWEKALQNNYVTNRLENKTMYGTIGHSQPLDDNAILEGKVSHIVSNLRIDESGRGIGEALIIDTPAGRVLNALLRAGSKLYVSSRAKGKFKGTHNGIPKVDEETYQMKTFDFVVDPGFLEANPDLKESYESLAEKEIENNIDSKGEPVMENEMIKSLHEQNNKHIQNIEKLNNKVSEQNDELNSLKEEKHNLNSEVEALKEVEEEHKKVSEELEVFKELGKTAEEIKESLTKLEETQKSLEEYKAIDPEATPKEIEETIDAANKLLTEYKAVAETPEKITETLEGLNTKISEYNEFGTVDDVAELFMLSKKLLENEEKRKVEESVAKLAKKIGVSEEKIAKVYDKLTEDEIVELFKGEDELKKYQEEKKRLSESNEEDLDLEEDEPHFKKKSLCESLLESF